MNQDQQVDNDLQKAIDDITNNTNSDPVFSDPVAAPSSVPEGDTGELAEPVGPFPIPKVEVVQTEEQMAPIEPLVVPDLPTPPADQPIPMPKPAPAPEPTPLTSPEPQVVEMQATETITTETAPNAPLNMHQVKEAALRDLVPLLDHLDMNPSQKFNMYRDIFEDLKDYTVLEPAYHAASEITDEHERAEALLYLVESIDKM